MDFLQIALIFLILLLSIFLAITGMQVFLILRDLKKALDKLNRVLDSGEVIAQDIERPIEAASNLVSALTSGAKTLARNFKKGSHGSTNKPKPKRFYRKVL